MSTIRADLAEKPFPMRRNVIPNRLAEATIISKGEEYLLRFAADDGASFELLATFEQLDILAEDIDRRLDADEEGDG